MNRRDMATAKDPNGNDRFKKDLWTLGWVGIRKANIGLANIDKLQDATQEEKDIIKGQLLFFRGWFHFEFMQYFGGLPQPDADAHAGQGGRASLVGRGAGP